MYSTFNIRLVILVALMQMLCLYSAYSWHTDELEVFDAVDEIKQNFYVLLEVSQNADSATIKKSFRKLSLTLHPDHNSSPTADAEFRNLVLAYDILKSPEKRRYYDNILENGLPDWRQAVYYYRRVRKMGLQEMCLILAIIVSIGQYLIAWASYLEKKITLKELLKSKDKKSRRLKKNKNDTSYADEMIENAISKPSVRNTLPFQICSLLKGLAIYSVKSACKIAKDNWSRQPEAKEHVRQRTENVPRPYQEKPKKVDFVPELVEEPATLVTNSTYSKPCNVVTESTPVISGGLWTDDDILTLVKLVKKHPAGEHERWVKIASAMNRTVAEVTHMANKIKDNDFRLPSENEEPQANEEPRKVKTKGGKLGTKIIDEEEASEKNSSWTQTQQKAFEMALNKYAKKSAGDRWEKIASCVPGKSKEDCILRYKKIVSLVQQRKLEESGQQESVSAENESNENEQNSKETKVEKLE